MMKPRIFVSTVSSELKTARQLVANVLTRLGYEPVFQEVFDLEPGDLRQVLREKIDDCVGLIQIVGRGYGAEPPTVDPDLGRVSYTQFEFLYARSKRKKTWLIFAEEGCTRDRSLDQLDRPSDQNHPDPDGYQAERRGLQAAWRQRWKHDVHLFHAASSDLELELRVERMKGELAELRKGFRRLVNAFLCLSAVLVGLLAWVLIGQMLSKRVVDEIKQDTVAIKDKAEEVQKTVETSLEHANTSIEDIKNTQKVMQENQKITAARIRGHLVQSSEKARDEELAVANKVEQYDERERLKELAENSHAARLSRIDDLVANIIEVEKREDVTDDFREMLRILTDERENAVDKAIAFSEKRRTARLDRVRARKQIEQARNRADLQTDLKASSLHATRGQTAEARALFTEILKLEPDWPEPLETFAWFLFDQSIQSETHGTLQVALADAKLCYELAERLYKIDETQPGSQRIFSAACNQMGDILTRRGQPGDADRAFSYYVRSLEEDERLLKQNPDSAQAARDVSVSLNKLGNFLLQRGQPGDADLAFGNYTRSLEELERLLKQTPDSAEAARDVSISLNKLGDFLLQRGQPGDADLAFGYYTRSLEEAERLLKQNQDSAQAARDVSLSLGRLGDFLSQRSQPGDADLAFGYYTRSLKELERLLKQNPDSAEAARDVSISLEKLGNFLSQRGQPGDADLAFGYYTRSLGERERLLEQSADSAEAARDVSISLNKLGYFLSQRGQPSDADFAFGYYTRSLEVRERLLKQNPDSAQAARDVSLSLEKLGNFLSQRGQPGDADLAFGYSTRSLKERERLLKQNPDSAQAARDVSLSLERLGDFLSQRSQPGDADLAFGYYTRSLKERERLLKQNPDSAEAARDVSVSLNKLGDFLSRRREPADADLALGYYKRDLEISERLLMQNPDSARPNRDVMVSHFKLGEFHVLLGNFNAAIESFQNGIDVLESMIEKQLSVESSKKEKEILERRKGFCQVLSLATGEWDALLKVDAEYLPKLLSIRAAEMAKRGKLADVAQAGAKLRELEPRTNDNLYNASCAYGLCATLVAKGEQNLTKAEQAEQRFYVELALTCLKEAIAVGYNNFDHMKQDTDLTPLRGLPEFEALFPK